MTNNNPSPLGPTDEHQRLLEKVGEWDVDCYYTMGADEPVCVKGTERVEAVGQFWIVGHFEVEVHGRKIFGRATTGYDSDKMAFIGTWFDSATPFFYYLEGNFSEDDTTLVLEGDNTDPVTRRLVLYRSEEEFVSPDRRVLCLSFETKPGDETPILRYEYSRRK